MNIGHAISKYNPNNAIALSNAANNANTVATETVAQDTETTLQDTVAQVENDVSDAYVFAQLFCDYFYRNGA